jgi:hypothetical protein
LAVQGLHHRFWPANALFLPFFARIGWVLMSVQHNLRSQTERIPPHAVYIDAGSNFDRFLHCNKNCDAD